MTAQELRIGNIIHFKPTEEDAVVFEILFNSVRVKMHPRNRYADENFIEGIPLTPEWLERFGFKQGGKNTWTIFHGTYVSGLDEPIREWFTVFDDLKFGCQLIYGRTSMRYVHQLQNLYFALTGQELELK